MTFSWLLILQTGMTEDTGMSGLLGALASKVDFKIKRVINGVAEEKERLQQEKERLLHEQQCQFHMHVKICF